MIIGTSRHRRRIASMCAALACAMLVWSSTGCSDSFRRSGPSDQITTGTLCLPSSESCANTARLVRDDFVGSNQLDYELTNLTDERAVVTVRVRTPSSSPPDADDAADTGTSEPTTLVELTERLDPSESRLGRLTQEQLTTRDVLVLTISCDDCDAHLDYALTNEPLECRTDDDCTGPWICLENSGRCVECETSADCDPEQTCSQQTNRCEPPASGGCQTSPGDRPGHTAVFLVVLLALALGAVRRRASWMPKPLLYGIVAVCLATAIPSVTRAAEPPRATFGMGVGPRWFTGELAGVTKRGIGLNIDQELRWSNFGAAVQLGTRYHLTTQDPPPLSRELQVYTVAVGPRAYVTIGDVSLMASAEYQHVGLVSNSVVRLTGPQLNYGSAGGSIGARYTISAIDLGLRAGFHPVFGLNGSLVSVDLTVRLSVK